MLCNDQPDFGGQVFRSDKCDECDGLVLHLLPEVVQFADDHL